VLLLEAKKLHPAVKDFETFLQKVHGLKLSRAYDLLRLAGGRTTDEELRKENRDRVKKHRDKKKPKPVPVPEPELPRLSAASPESAEVSAERRKAENAAAEAAPELSVTSSTVTESAEEKAAKASAHYFAEFVAACRTYLPKITVEADRQKARLLVSELTSGKPKMKAA
jgi:hypothetical protein